MCGTKLTTDCFDSQIWWQKAAVGGWVVFVSSPTPTFSPEKEDVPIFEGEVVVIFREAHTIWVPHMTVSEQPGYNCTSLHRHICAVY